MQGAALEVEPSTSMKEASLREKGESAKVGGHGMGGVTGGGRGKGRGESYKRVHVHKKKVLQKEQHRYLYLDDACKPFEVGHASKTH
ncbi:hypothetical protein OS493_012310 [Desmophyllum pertusum]|uniref:Uncharacterized protein n=1 Tax=Desmophyllum pertusum TaxID=174260 RepID=A0A9X0D3J3_9CNID|nr:hypothetical protein OS493_012310 [Desmophyllum pertusum]